MQRSHSDASLHYYLIAFPCSKSFKQIMAGKAPKSFDSVSLTVLILLNLGNVSDVSLVIFFKSIKSQSPFKKFFF
jgi:hypothetical protein